MTVSWRTFTALRLDRLDEGLAKQSMVFDTQNPHNSVFLLSSPPPVAWQTNR